MVDLAGFGPFVRGLNLRNADWGLFTALVERWWDCTNTFHFTGVGELTVTPLDFTFLTGLRVGGEPLPIDPHLWRREGAVIELLGRTPAEGLTNRVRMTWLRETFGVVPPPEGVTAEQLARAFLLHMLGQTLFASRGSWVYLHCLAPLADLGRASVFNWGGAGLGTLYSCLSAVYRGSARSLGGFARVLELSFRYSFSSFDCFDIPLLRTDNLQLTALGLHTLHTVCSSY